MSFKVSSIIVKVHVHAKKSLYVSQSPLSLLKYILSHFVSMLHWDEIFLLQRNCCWNLKILCLPGADVTTADWWGGFGSIFPQVLIRPPTFLSIAEQYPNEPKLEVLIQPSLAFFTIDSLLFANSTQVGSGYTGG